MSPIGPKVRRIVLVALLFVGLPIGIVVFSRPALHAASEAERQSPPTAGGFAGSQSCRECHERFYQLWSTSFHGLAMQPYTEALGMEKLTPQEKDITIGSSRYRAELGRGGGAVLETGPDGSVRRYPIAHALGGKNIYYFLTPMERGRLQTLPIAYDVRRKEWLDTALSGVRHFPGRQERDEPVGWQEWPYTFNTACHGCHVSQLSTNYDLKTDTYHTTWAEPGINCETCHGPAAAHNQAAREAPRGQPLLDMKIIRTKTMTGEQRNHLCASCHAKTTTPLTSSYVPGDRFFDHFDLVTLESTDYYPDGRDLGENYTYTSWLMSPCVKSGKIDCVHCHTSSGRYRFKKEEDANRACLPCHEERVNHAPIHTRHEEKSPGNRCISCHMPMTSFARMNRSDHSMLPPVPAATIAYQSPNACNLCHTDKDAAWADQMVRQWRPRDYQASVLLRAGLVDAARKRNWSRRGEMLQYVVSGDHDPVFTASLLRLMPASSDQNTRRALLRATEDASPLVRAAAVEALALAPSQESLQAVIAATGDDCRLVRVRAAAALPVFPRFQAGAEYGEKIKKAGEEYLASLSAWPDQWASHYNLGNYYLGRGKIQEAIASYDHALAIEPRSVVVMVNSSIAYAQMGDSDKAEASLRRALKVAPDNAEAHFNMGLLQAERNDPRSAESHLRAALKSDPQMAPAALNLCVLIAGDRPGEALGFCQEAVRLRPDDPKYAYTLAYTLQRQGRTPEARSILKGVLERYPGYRDASALYGELSAKEQQP